MGIGRVAIFHMGAGGIGGSYLISAMSGERPADDQGAVVEVKLSGEDHMRRKLSDDCCE